MNKLNTIDGETLMSRPLQPLNFVVDTLISQGLHILAGSPKVGKSWLALWLAVTVAKGEPVWGMQVKKGTTLYMEYEGYKVTWTDARKHITFTCPNGRKCRDNSLHDETFLKENLEALFAYRQEVGFYPGTDEPEMGWLGELASGWFRVTASLEQDAGQQLPASSVWTDSKQRRREALKKLAMGQKFSGYENYELTM